MKWVLGWTLAAGACLAQTAPQAAGHWQGKILIPDHETAFTVDLDRNAKGAWIGSITIPGSTSIDVPLGNFEAAGTTVRFTAPLPGPTKFAGAVSADGAAISGTASNVQGDARFQLSRSGAANVKVPPPSSTLLKEFEGTWEGTIESGGKVRRVGLELATDADGRAVGTLVAIDQGNLQIPASTVTVQGKNLQVESRAISGMYRGALGADGDIAGEWTQGDQHMALVFKRK
jgi:hypothetical protein